MTKTFRFASNLSLLLATIAATSLASPAEAVAGPAKVDISKFRHELTVLSDGKGHYVIVREKKGPRQLFYGDGATFYRQRVSGRSLSANSSGHSFWEPRSRPWSTGQLQHRKGVWTLTCDKVRKTVLREEPAAKAKTILTNARFFERKWNRLPYALARDDRGNYYYVDRLRMRDKRGFRLFVGKRGAMKQRKMINVVSDSEGDIFATKNGDLRMILHQKSAAWVRSNRKKPLTYVPVDKNAYLIYAELVYGNERLGTPCDDL